LQNFLGTEPALGVVARFFGGAGDPVGLWRWPCQGLPGWTGRAVRWGWIGGQWLSPRRAPELSGDLLASGSLAAGWGSGECTTAPGRPAAKAVPPFLLSVKDSSGQRLIPSLARRVVRGVLFRRSTSTCDPLVTSAVVSSTKTYYFKKNCHIKLVIHV
jgi:hypothetical protein